MTKKLLSLLTLICVVSIVTASNAVQIAKKPTNIHTDATNPNTYYKEGTAGVIDELNNPGAVKVFPNPTNTVVNIAIENVTLTNAHLVIFDITGKKIIEQNITKSVNTINVADFNNGVFVYTITDANGKILKSGKFDVVK
jgi:hypothetical protein